MPTAAPRRILLADADAFYVSVARLVDPTGAGQARLLIVGGSAEGRGVVLSASYEARAHGVQSAMPMARALRLCPDAMVVPVPWKVCAGMGREIRHVLERFTPVVQQASIDEFYLDLSGTERLYHDEPLPETARRIRAAVLEATGLSLSIGGGSSRLVAKMAAGVAKPGPDRSGEGVHVVPDGQEIAFMRRFALADIPGVGPKTAARLARVDLRAVNDVLALELPVLKERLGKGREREAEWLFRRARGLDRTPVEHRLHNKSISRDETFGQDLDADADLARELAEVTRTANRANATLYTIDPRGLVAGPDIDQPLDPVEFGDYVRKTQDSLRVLAEETGGIAVVNQNNFDAALKRIDAETSDYYMLGYSSTNADPLERTRKIEVRLVNKPGVSVWSRTSYSLRPLPPATQK